MTELKKCPKCGSTGKVEKLYTMFQTDTVPFKWAVICCNCRFLSQSKGTIAAAIREWNRRAET